MKHKLREDLVTWYKLTFAICRKRDPKSLYSLRDQLVCGIRNPSTRKKANWRLQLSGSFFGGYRWWNCGQGDPASATKQTLQQAKEVSKDSSFSPLHVLSVTHRDKELVKIRCLQARRWHTLVFFCRSGVHARPITNSNFEKLYFAAAMYVLPHIARVCEKRRVNTFTVEEELLEESSSCIRLSRIRMACQDRNLCSRRGVHEHFECRGRVARRIFELYAAV